jgi:hypothetical protein
MDYPQLKEILLRKCSIKNSRRENQEAVFSKYLDEAANKRGAQLLDRIPVKANVDEIFSTTNKQAIHHNILQHRAKKVLSPIPLPEFRDKSPENNQSNKTLSLEPRRVLFRGVLPAISKEKAAVSSGGAYQKIMSNMNSNALILEGLTKNTSAKPNPPMQIFFNTDPVFQDQLKKRRRRFELQKEKELRRDLKLGIPAQASEVFTINVTSKLLRRINYSPRKINNVSFEEPRISVRGLSEDYSSFGSYRRGDNGSSRLNGSFL